MNSNSPDFREPVGLAAWLGAGSIFIVLVAVSAMALTCSVLLRHQVQQQGLVQAELAVTSAGQLLQRESDALLGEARSLGAQLPTERSASALSAWLAAQCRDRALDACAAGSARTPTHLADGSALPWNEIEAAADTQGERFIVAPADGAPLLWGAAAPAPDGRRTLVLRQIAARRLAQLGAQVGAELTLTSMRGYTAPAGAVFTALHTQMLGAGHTVALHLAAHDDYAGSTTIKASRGQVLGLLDARLSGAPFSEQLRRFNRLLWLAAAIGGVIAGLLGLQFGRWIARPVIALRDAVQRIGRGDLATAIPPVAPREVQALATSMEQMRQSLVGLTDTLRQREAEANALLNGIVEGVFAVDAERRVRYANPQVAKLLAVPEHQILGQFCGDVLRPALVNGLRPCQSACPILAARQSGQATAREELCLTDGTTRSTILVSAAPVMGLQVQILRDETDLEAVRRARDSVFANISHEFRTPLAAQLAAIELLRDGLSSMEPPAQRELLANVERGVLRLMRLIDNLLESVRIESGQLAIRQQPLDLDAVVTEAAELLAPLLAQRGLTLDIRLPAAAGTVQGDAPRLQQVFVNLLANAVKFAPQNSTIHLGGLTTPGHVQLWVEDEGPGVTADSQRAIFERFRRAANAEPESPGLGLGLWIVRSIIERHGGAVRVERTPASRTRFTLDLPVEVDP